MMGRLQGRIAIVTGASSGIGAALALAIGAEGASVVVNYNKNEEGAKATVERIVASGARATAVQGDVTRAPDVSRLFEVANREFGIVDTLVNNSGVYSFGPVAQFSAEEYGRIFDSNVLSVFLTTQAMVNQIGGDGGSITNIVSAAVETRRPNSAIYSASKSAVVTATTVLSRELGPMNIRVNALGPGGTETEGWNALAGDNAEAIKAQIVASTPLGRLGRTSDIAPVAVFLASKDAGWITGQLILASGGMR